MLPFISSPRFLILLAFCLSLVSVRAADLAPAVFPPGTYVDLYGTITHSGGTFEDRSAFFFSTPTTFIGVNVTGNSTYTKTGPATATLSYTSTLIFPGGSENEAGSLQLTFTESGAGTYVRSGSYSGIDGGGPYSGSFTGSGQFFVTFPDVTPPPVVSDNFNDSSKDPLKWGTDFSLDTPATLAETAGRLEYRSAAAGAQDANRPWILNPPRYHQDWQMVVDVRNSLNPAGDADAGLGIEITRQGSRNNYVWLDLSMFKNSEGFHRAFNTVSSSNAYFTLPAPLASAALRVAFDSTDKVLYCYYDTDGAANGYAWTIFASYRIDETGEGVEDWGMADGDAFQIALYGFSRSTAVPAGQIYFEDFRITPGSPLTPLQQWKTLYFPDPGGPLTGNLEDYDKDGVSNILEFAFNLNPASPVNPLPAAAMNTGLPWIRREGSGSAARLRIDYLRRRAVTTPGISYEPQFSNRLAASGPEGWQTATGVESVTILDSTWERVSILDHGPAGQPSRFGRVKVATP